MDQSNVAECEEADFLETDALISDGVCDESGSSCRKSLSMDEALMVAGFGRFQYLLVATLGWAQSADAVEMMSISYVLPSASCELKPSSLLLGFLTAAGFVGMMFGGCFWGAFADQQGRRKALLLCQSVNAIFIVFSALTQSFWLLVLMRFMSGFGVGGTNPLVFVFLVEFLPHQKRGPMVGLLSACFMIGQVLTAGMAWFIIPHREWGITSGVFVFDSWRIFLLLSAVPCLSSVFLFLAFPESPCYLAEKKKFTEATKVLRRMHSINGLKSSFPVFNIKMHPQDGRAQSRGGFRESLREVGARTLNLVTERGVRGNFLYSSVILFCLSFGSYGLTMWFPVLFERMEFSNSSSVCDTPSGPFNDSSKQDPCLSAQSSNMYFDSFLQAITTAPGNLLFFLLIDHVGRKIIIASSMILSGLSVFFIWFVSNRTQSIVISCVFSGISVMAWNGTNLLNAEMFPTKLRSTAQGFQSGFMIRVAAILATIIFGALIDTHCAVPILLIAALFCVGGLVTYKLPRFPSPRTQAVL